MKLIFSDSAWDDYGVQDEAITVTVISVGKRGVAAGHGITPDGVYKLLRDYAALAKIDIEGLGPHSLRASAATNALDNEANIATTRIDDRRRMRSEDSPTFKVSY